MRVCVNALCNFTKPRDRAIKLKFCSINFYPGANFIRLRNSLITERHFVSFYNYTVFASMLPYVRTDGGIVDYREAANNILRTGNYVSMNQRLVFEMLRTGNVDSRFWRDETRTSIDSIYIFSSRIMFGRILN